VSDQAAFQEVDEAVRQDDIRALWKRWGTLTVTTFVVLVVATAGFIEWRKYEASRAAAAGAAYSAAVAKIGSDVKAARAELEQQASTAPEPYRSLAALAGAQLLDTREQQIAALVALAPKLSAEMSDLALVLAGYRSVDPGTIDAMAGQLQDISAPGRQFRPSARELQALALVKRGDIGGARAIWEEIGKDGTTPPGVAQRTAAMLAFYPPPAEAK
jgi:hypothetical protein